MKPETIVNAAIGFLGSFVGWMTSEDAGIFASVSAGLWMLWQIGCSIYDRATGRKNK